MTIGKDRLERTMRERANTVERTNPRYSGFLGLTTGGEDVVDVPSRPGFVWVRLRNVGNEVIKAFNDSVSPIFNLPVIVERDLSSPIQYKVLGRDVDVYGASNWGTASSYVPGHNAQHSFDKSDQGTGGDITWIFTDQFLPLLVTPSGSAGSPNALVWPYLYHDDEGNYFCGGNTGTASLVGNNATGGNNSRMSLIYLDADTGNPTILAGTTEFASTITGTCGVLPYIPGVPDNNDIALAGVRLPTGTSTINWANLYDIREFVHTHPQEGTGSAGAYIWTTDANVVNLLADGDTVTIGSNTAGGKLFVDGDADEIQLRIQAHSTQTANMVEYQRSTSTVYGGVDPIGRVGVGSAPTVHAFVTVSPSGGVKILSGSEGYGINCVPSWAPDDANRGKSYFGVNCDVIIYDVNATGVIEGVVGGRFRAYSRSATQTVTSLVGGEFKTYNYSSSTYGNVTTSTAGKFSAIVNGGTWTDHFGAYIANPTGAGTITNNYGLYIEGITKGGTINYAIYTNAGTVWINAGGDADTDFIVSGDSEPNLLRVDAGEDAVRIGDWDTNYADFASDGDLTFVGTAGLQFGEIYVEGIDTDEVLAAQDTYYQVEAWSISGSGVDGNANGTTPDVTNDHITIAEEGMYYVHWHVACYSAQKHEYEFEIFANNGATGYPNTENYRTTSVASAIGAVSGGGICDFSAGDTVELWVERKDGGAVAQTLTIRAATISVFQIGGT